jgi:2-polyprenyl-3-methyl-5-hydroxy-6-metoxy-1,4-benzoquinol methylase
MDYSPVRTRGGSGLVGLASGWCRTVASSGVGRAGADRLQVLGRQWPTTSALRDRVGVSAGVRCLDLGCGAGDVTLEFAHRVGQRGLVTAVDMDALKVNVTSGQAAAGGLGGWCRTVV